MNWTLKYRPNQVKNLNLKEARERLLKFLKDGYIPQVLLFAGPKGTGKTSSSRLVAAVLNEEKNKAQVKKVYFKKEKPTKPLAEPDLKNPLIKKILTGKSYVVNEIDAASTRGIDDIRELKERAFTPPVEGTMSVFILDEVHMLTTPAFNALLKLLEEPPEHAVFILATTEPEKIPATVVSRCQVIRFRKADEAEIMTVLEQVAKKEALKAEKAALLALTQLADGSFRDAIKYLELAVKDQKVTLESVRQVVGVSLDQEAQKLLDLILAKDEAEISLFFETLRSINASEKIFHQAFINLLYTQLIQKLKDPASKNLDSKISFYLLKQFNDPGLTESVVPFLGLELKALEIVQKSKGKNPKSKNQKPKSEVQNLKLKTQNSKLQLKTNSSHPAPALHQDKQRNEPTRRHPELPLSCFAPADAGGFISGSHIADPRDSETPEAHTLGVQNDNHHPLGDGNEVIGHWEKFLNLVEEKNSTIAALLRSAKPAHGDRGKVVVYVYYRFHQEQLTNPKIVNLIQEVLNHLSLGFVEFEFVLKESEKPQAQTASFKTVMQNPQLAKVAAEVLT